MRNGRGSLGQHRLASTLLPPVQLDVWSDANQRLVYLRHGSLADHSLTNRGRPCTRHATPNGSRLGLACISVHHPSRHDIRNRWAELRSHLERRITPLSIERF